MVPPGGFGLVPMLLQARPRIFGLVQGHASRLPCVVPVPGTCEGSLFVCRIYVCMYVVCMYNCISVVCM